MSQHIFISGGTGYLGANYLVEAVKRGDRVTLLCRPSSCFSIIDSLAGQTNWRNSTRILKSDLTESVVDAIYDDNADMFVHCAASGRYETPATQICNVLNANIKLGSLMLEGVKTLTAKTNRQRPFVFCGSYWQNSGQSSENLPNSFYAATKSAFEEVARFYSQTLRLPVVGLKFYDIYGPNDPRLRLVDLILKSMHQETPVKMSLGEQKLRLVHVKDAVSAIDHALAYAQLSRPSPSLKMSYGVYGDELVSIRELTRKLEDMTGLSANIEWGARAYREFEIFEPFLVERLPSWSVKVSLADGLDTIINSDRLNMQGQSS